jgi:hypothetical protein
LVALAGLLTGLIAFGVGEAIYKLIPAKRVMINTMGRMLPATTPATESVADTQNAALAFGVLGACLGGCLGIAGGLARRSASAMVAAGLLGSILGSALAAGLSFVLLPYFMSVRPGHPEYDLILSMMMHGLIWGLPGAAAGLALAVGLGERRLLGPALTGGFLGALLGTIAFDLIGAGLFPLAHTGDPISTIWPTRLMARLCVTVATAAIIILLLPGPRPTQAAGQPVVAPPPPH